MPLLIVLLTLILDKTKPEDADETSYPNVGKYVCFPGNKREEGSDRPNYVTTAFFLYFQLEVLILLFTNVILVGLSFLHIHEPFRNKIRLMKSQEKKNQTEEEKKINREEFKLCLYFFVITG